MDSGRIKKIVREKYAGISAGGCGCGPSCCGGSASSEEIARSIGYSDDEIQSAPEANLGLGCGNPTAFSGIMAGETVLDLGSGPGFDAFLAAEKTGTTGRVIGVDMTEEMVRKAGENAKKYSYTNVEFRHGDIEALPVQSGSIDVIISNCVINLAPDRQKVFHEAWRALKTGGRMHLSDIVLLEELSEDQRNDPDLIAGCVGGALMKEEYIAAVKNAGFIYSIDREDRGVSGRQYGGINLESIHITAWKQ